MKPLFCLKNVRLGSSVGLTGQYSVINMSVSDKTTLMMSFRRIFFTAIMLACGALPVAAQSPKISVGEEMPMQNEPLTTAEGEQVSLSGLAGNQGTVVIFWSNQCPWVSKYEQRVQDLASSYGSKGYSFVLVNPNDPSAFPKESREASQGKGYQVPYLMDTESRLARAFGATRTPQVFVFDASNTLSYTGTIDDSPGDPGNVNENYLEEALDAVAQGEEVSTSTTKPFGCMIKFSN